MNKKGLTLLMLLGFLLNFCDNNKQDSIIGKYENFSEKNAIHYIKLNSDSTYIHFYKNELNEKSDTANWRFNLEKDGDKTVIFYNWNSYGIKTELSCENCVYVTTLKGNEIVFSEDLPVEMNFIKEK